jgi:hypothetical protein
MGSPVKYQATIEGVLDDTITMLLNGAKQFGEDGIELATDVANFVDTIRRQLRGPDADQAIESIWVGAKLKMAGLADKAARAYLSNILSIGLKWASAIGGNVIDDLEDLIKKRSPR